MLSSDHNINRAGLTRSVECDGGGQEESLHCWHRGRRPPSYGGPPLLTVVLRLRHQWGGVHCAAAVSRSSVRIWSGGLVIYVSFFVTIKGWKWILNLGDMTVPMTDTRWGNYFYFDIPNYWNLSSPPSCSVPLGLWWDVSHITLVTSFLWCLLEVRQGEGPPARTDQYWQVWSSLTQGRGGPVCSPYREQLSRRGNTK